MEEHLLNIREAAAYLGIGERSLKELADKGRIPAYKIGGTFLRFKKSQLEVLKADFAARAQRKPPLREAAPVQAGTLDGFKDFLYFNDFYILSVIVIILAVVLMIAT